MSDYEPLWAFPPVTDKAVRCAACVGTGYPHGRPLTICRPCLGRGWLNYRPAFDGPLSAYEKGLERDVESRDGRASRLSARPRQE